MEIPKDILRCVIFLCVKTDAGNFVPAGTGFLVGVPIEGNPSLVHPYIVTAKHNIEKIGQREMSMRVNGKEGGRMDIVATGAVWFTHPTDDNVDVAVFPFDLPVDHGHSYIPLQMFLGAENVKNGDVEMGNDVFIIGLFTHHHGKFSNLPIVRVGNIAMLPTENEKVAISWHEAEVEAYLIEARSIGGLSGSPVFFHQPYYKQEGQTRVPRKELQIYLGGLIHGHWSTDSSKIDDALPDGSAEEKNVNMGIAIVIPAHKILEVLMQDSLKEKRREISARLAEQESLQKAIDIQASA